MKLPPAAKNAMLSGIGVSRIQNWIVVGAPKRKIIPSAPLRSVTPIRPRCCCSIVCAAHRQTSHVRPSAAVTRPATVSKPDGATPDVDAVDVVGIALVVPPVVTAGSVTVVDPAGDEPPLLHAATSASTTTDDRHAIGATVGVRFEPVPATCDSCGAPEDELFAVRRQYVTPAEWDTPAREVTLDEVEHWCYSCCTHYPHVEV
jgi:hypothetical protein